MEEKPKFARETVRKVLEKNNGNVSKTAKILGISRKTVRRARDGSLSDLSKKPLSSPNKTPPNFENLIVSEAKRTGFSYRRLKSFLQRKYSLSFSENTIKAILKRNNFFFHTRNFNLILNIYWIKILFLFLSMNI